MSERADDDVIELRLMNEYSVSVPLWDDYGHCGEEGLDLSPALLAELRAFAERWESSVSPEVYDDRWDGVPVMQKLVSARYAWRRLIRPSQRRAAAREDEAMRELGAVLRDHVQRELGPRYRVTYLH